ncbi:hypothetical protein CWE22_02145 [Pseudidiomarina aestuarii]|uniref:Uncharacterized protein n=1 Tax=Pseudidiomarina aestuarii TaxID=624146 RepID=A0A7Z7ETE0_9GAMM|nr:hypothetical protein [Pseudidiomarina aestuarii]RUO41018.1 hypothetical protein CWE22_02145 [Pseudidiomarina aestuarii]
MSVQLFSKKLIITIVSVIVCGVFLALLVDEWLAESSARNRNELYQNLLERSGQLNRDLPKLLDRQTRFERAEVVNYGMRFVYSLINIDKFQYEEDELKEQIEPQMLRFYCSDPGLEYFRQYADHVEIRYQDRKERHLFTLRYEPQQCQSG